MVTSKFKKIFTLRLFHFIFDLLLKRNHVHFFIGFQANSKKSLPGYFFSLFLTYYKKGSSKVLLDRLLPLLKEMRFIIKKCTKQFLSVYMIPQFCIKNILLFCVLSIKNIISIKKSIKYKKV